MDRYVHNNSGVEVLASKIKRRVADDLGALYVCADGSRFDPQQIKSVGQVGDYVVVDDQGARAVAKILFNLRYRPADMTERLPDAPRRHLTGHQTNPCNEQIDLVVLDGPGEGGACHEYEIIVKSREGIQRQRLSFQNGPIKEVGTNGITQEVLLAVLIDRLEHFQAGRYACRENALALTKLEEAQMWLHSRTRQREGRGVEGTHEV